MRIGILVAACWLASCGGGTTPDPEDAQLALQPLGAPEVEQYGIRGIGCAFVPEGGGIGSLYLANDEAAYIKVGGKVIPLAKVEGSRELPADAWENYAGGGYSVSLVLSGDGEQRGNGVADYKGRLGIRDAKGITVYAASGLTRCGA